MTSPLDPMVHHPSPGRAGRAPRPPGPPGPGARPAGLSARDQHHLGKRGEYCRDGGYGEAVR